MPEVDGFDVGRLLGRGGAAAVWLATEHVTRRDVALKCFAPPGDTAPGDVGDQATGDAGEAVRRELGILSALEHEHLIKARDVVRVRYGTGGGRALILDYAAGGSLAQLLAARGSLGAGETVTVLTPVAQALAYLHANGFTHGDVAPGNVLFTAHGKPLLSDLGVARMMLDPGEAVRPGTEGFRDPAPVDAVRAGLYPESDVYSAAALGWFCLTGRAPAAQQQRPPLPLLLPEVPVALAEVLEAGLREDRRLRPSAAEFAAAVFRSARAEPVDLSGSAHPTVLPELLTRRSVPSGAGGRRAARLRAALARWRWRRQRSVRERAAVGPVRERAAVEPVLRQRAVVGPGADAAGRRRARHAAGARGGRRLRRAGMTLLISLAVTAAGVFGTLLVAGSLATGQWAPELRPAAEQSLAPTTGPDNGEHAQNGGQGDARGIVPAGLRGPLGADRPEDAVGALAALRSYAFNTGNTALLQLVTVPDSPAAAADAAVGTRLARSGHVLEGFDARLSQLARQPGSTPARAVVSVRVDSPPYRERDADGTVIAEAAAHRQQLRLVLVPVDGQWRIQEILPGG
ncbi:serine/threonine-protein kinase [Arthrobacter sp. Hor0625]|uniref:serine/threonine-protein kinase n=1 Tax=Arthrobacter sp. Hor0625 TaxID=3457358 RepID=UPI00403E6347